MSTDIIVQLPALPALISDEERDMVATAAAIAADVLVTDEASCLEARSLMEDVAELAKMLETRRETVKRPFLAAGREIDKILGEQVKWLGNVVASLKTRIGGFVEAREAEKRKAEAAAAAKVAAGAIPPITQEVIAAHAASAKPLVKTREYATYEIEDEAAVPREFLMVDMPKIRDSWEAGTPVPGTRRVVQKKVTL